MKKQDEYRKWGGTVLKLYATVLTVSLAQTLTFGQKLDPGVRIEFTGNEVFSENELSGVTQKCLASDSHWNEKTDSSTLEYCLSRLEFYIRGKGYLQAKVGKPGKHQSQHGWRVVVAIEEGALFRLGKIEIKQSKVFSPDRLLQMLDVKTGDIADGVRLSKWLLESAKQAYDRLGYIQYVAELEPVFTVIDRQHGIVDLIVTIDEGNQFVLGSLTFNGTGNVQEDLLVRQMFVRIGDVFNRQLFEEGLKVIDQSEMFLPIDAGKDVDYKTDDEKRQVHVTVHLKRRPTCPTFRLRKKTASSFTSDY